MRMNVSEEPAGELRLRPLSARSVVLSLLLGTHPPELPLRELTRAVEPFGVQGSTLRAALSRMTAAGDLHRTDTGYRIGDRLLARQRRQDEAVAPRTRAWHGDWEMVVVTATGRGPAERADLRTRLTGLRLAELREGVWLRPANLDRAIPADLADVAETCTARPDRPAVELAAALWPLDAWSATARGLLAHVAAADTPAVRLAAFAAVVRHLLADPVLPPPLLPAGWPGGELRAAYAAYQREMAAVMRQRPYGEA
ncbi:PaaX domain-containing protein, C- domain protein [Streptomyces sp. XM83C]|jgi:phenylacetic acid degradation operon negative regulatory protein|uniref:PaaX family transcriptional regulator C-terminal domain-containing protein n=1 Tax=Streptomyces thermocoprophilus TaxID=78356 RepID=A0ABV5V8A1_9ACTN|nr:PaaX family transcriptional regulator C-terminal domain-containing protein [Streptomyces sp. XM83C]MCK1819329.1 PaaX domain-containing protein, C- domain protein [Streptomyces sp. XM83C]